MNPVAQVVHVKDGEKTYECLAFICPGCKAMHPNASGFHLLPVNSTTKTPQWDWDGNLEAPTLSPSILTKHGTIVDGVPTVCHSYLRAGVFEFLSDCTHSLVGQHVQMVPLEDWMMH